MVLALGVGRRGPIEHTTEVIALSVDELQEFSVLIRVLYPNSRIGVRQIMEILGYGPLRAIYTLIVWRFVYGVSGTCITLDSWSLYAHIIEEERHLWSIS